VHALGGLGEEVDLEALDAATQLGHGVRRKGAVDAGLERRQLVLRKYRTRDEECRDHDRSKTLHHFSLPFQ
jgi:hypothetical protein